MNDLDSQHDNHHNHKINSTKTNTLYNWRIYHPYEDVEKRVCVEVNAWRGLLYRWRFIIPHDYKGIVKWGVGKSGTGIIKDSIKSTKLANGRLLFFGNGASASLCSHAATDFTKQAKITSLAFNDHNLITALSNDYGYDEWVSKAIQLYFGNQYSSN